ncbi:hypothetical protein HMPREF9141_1080 [Prevotella multiformis DSM 16608]|uniref:Uncharacterized protein n=1 Tax=Prevotella multiformis DSM 16608 TaxID=888743 RepID=F0F663_9BACT|nr:hypothetical protein HMPREF9141_1080 [Prevotella multiformis DSM 16608]
MDSAYLSVPSTHYHGVHLLKNRVIFPVSSLPPLCIERKSEWDHQDFRQVFYLLKSRLFIPKRIRE